MAVTPHQLDLWSSQFAELYNAMEGEIIRQLIKRLSNGKTDVLEWQAEALKDLHLFNDDVVKILSKVTGVAEPMIKAMFEKAGHESVQEIDDAVPVDPNPIPTDIDNIIRNYSNQCWSDIDNLVNQTLVSTNYGYGTTTQAYTQVLNRTQALFNSGMLTFEQATERAIQELAAQGIKSTFVDKGGHTWSMERYVRTVMKSTLSNTYDQVRKERMDEYGVHTVKVSQHVGAREACTRIQGHVVDLRPMDQIPADSEYKSIYDPIWQADYEEPGGHRGINCTHLHTPFIPGVNINHSEPIDPELNKQVRADMDKQRYYERRIVKLKKNKMVSEALGNEDEARRYQQGITAAQKAIRELVNSDDYISRRPKREKVYTPLETLLRDTRFSDFTKE